MTEQASSRKIGSFHPPQRTLMGPGPSEINPRVLAAMSLPAIGYLDPKFVEMMEELKILLRYAFQTDNPLTFPISGPGSVGMESCFVNMVAPGDKVIVGRNGVFGGRMIENVERAGGVAVVVEDAWGDAGLDPNKIEAALKAHPDARIVAFVQAETSTGCLSDAKTLTALAHEHDALVIVDAVTSLGGSPVLVDEWGMDAVYSASQKCLSLHAGPLAGLVLGARGRLREEPQRRRSIAGSWTSGSSCNYWGSTTRTYHHTAPINGLFALHEALLLLREETLERAWERHTRHYLAFKAGLEAMGLKFLVREDARLPQMSAVYVPKGVNEAEVRRSLLSEFNLEIGAGLGPLAGKVWRFGLMGYSCKPENVMLCLSALGSVLMDAGLPIEVGAAEAAAHHSYALQHSRAAQQARERVAAA